MTSLGIYGWEIGLSGGKIGDFLPKSIWNHNLWDLLLSWLVITSSNPMEMPIGWHLNLLKPILETSLGILGLEMGLSGGKIAHFYQNLHEITIYGILCCLVWLLPPVILWKCRLDDIWNLLKTILETSLGIFGLEIGLSGGKIAHFYQNLYEIAI